MKAHEFLVKVIVKVVVDVRLKIIKFFVRDEKLADDEKVWRTFTAKQFFAGYAPSDSIYDTD